MTEDERDEIESKIPRDMVVWSFEDEIPDLPDHTLDYWGAEFGHPSTPSGRCKEDAGGPCIYGVFTEALIASVVRELDKIGALRKPSEIESSHDRAFAELTKLENDPDLRGVE